MLPDEPQVQTDLSEHAAGEGTHGDLFESALNEGEGDAVIEELSAQDGDLTIEDLRRLPGADEYSDEELLAEWQKAQETATTDEGEEGEEGAEEFKLPFPIFDDKGQQITDVDKLNLRDFLAGKYQIGYNANKAEQRKTLSDIIRVAQLGHFKESQFATAQQERNQIFQQLQEATQRTSQYDKDRKQWDYALTQFAQGNIEPMQRLATAYQQALSQIPQEEVADPRQAEAETARGYQFVYEQIIPRAAQLAQQFGGEAGQITQMILQRIGQEPSQFLTAEKINSIMEYEIPMALEQQGGHAAPGAMGTPATAGNADVEALKAQVAALQATVAQQANAKTAAARERSRKAPPAGGGSVPSAGDSMPALKSREDMKKWLRGDV